MKNEVKWPVFPCDVKVTTCPRYNVFSPNGRTLSGSTLAWLITSPWRPSFLDTMNTVTVSSATYFVHCHMVVDLQFSHALSDRIWSELSFRRFCMVESVLLGNKVMAG